MPEFPGITHVALTVSDLGRSRPWYEALFGSPPVIDEDTGPFHHVVWLLGGQTLIGIHHFPDLHGSEPFDERRPGLDHLAFAYATGPNSSNGSPDSMSWALPTEASSMLPMVRASRSATPTTSPWSSSRRPGRDGRTPSLPRCFICRGWLRLSSIGGHPPVA